MEINEKIRLRIEKYYDGSAKSIISLRVSDPHHMGILAECFRKEVDEVVLHGMYGDRLFQYALSLIDSSRTLDMDSDFRYWSPADSIDGMPGDTRVYLMYMPTYLASSALLYIYDKANDEQKYAMRAALCQALHACCGRNFRGHGYDADDVFIETMDLFRSLGADILAEKYHKEFPDFAALVRDSLPLYLDYKNGEKFPPRPFLEPEKCK